MRSERLAELTQPNRLETQAHLAFRTATQTLQFQSFCSKLFNTPWYKA